MAGPAVMILHGLRAGSPVVTDTGCCLSAARRTQAWPSGPQFESPACIAVAWAKGPTTSGFS